MGAVNDVTEPEPDRPEPDRPGGDRPAEGPGAERPDADEGWLDDDLDDLTGAFELELELEAGSEPDEGLAAGGPVAAEDGQVAYDCAAWAGESRGLLTGLLSTHGVPHAWQGTTLNVREEDEAVVDGLIDDVMASARPALDPAEEKLVYEVGTWPASLQTALADGLTAGDLPYEWDERGDLVVYAADEEAVEAVLEELPDPEEVEGAEDADDGIAFHEVLDRLFVAADRLSRRPTDAGAVVEVDEAVARLESMALPFGFEPAQWRSLVQLAARLRGALAAGSGDTEALGDDDLADLAGRVRDTVQRYV